MSTSVPEDIENPLDYSGFLAVQWSLTGLALLLTVGRYVIRLKMQSRLSADDYCHGFAMLILIVLMALSTVFFPITIAVEVYGIDHGARPSMSELKKFVRLLVACEILFWVVLFSVKFAFLFLYRQIFGVSQTFRRVWWVVFIYTIATFWAGFLTVFWSCGTPSKLLDISACLSTDARNVVDNYAETMVALNIAGDLAIIILPLFMLKGLHMKSAQKLGLAAMFLLGGVVIFFDIARLAIGDGGGAISLATLWDVLEPITAVIISSLIPYRVLLPQGRGKLTSYQRNKLNAGSGNSTGKGSTQHQLHSLGSTIDQKVPSKRSGSPPTSSQGSVREQQSWV